MAAAAGAHPHAWNTMGSEVYGNHCSARNGDTDHILVASVLGDGIAASYRRISDGGGGVGG